jgi:hypothetical protein
LVVFIVKVDANDARPIVGVACVRILRTAVLACAVVARAVVVVVVVMANIVVVAVVVVERWS